MPALGGLLAAAILKVVAEQIASVIGGRITLQNNFDEDLNKMKMTLESVEAVLKVAERQSVTNEVTRLWLKRLTDAMYDISDMIDEFEAIIQPSARKPSLKKHLLPLACCLRIGPNITMANEMKLMRDKLKEISDQHHNFIMTAHTSYIQLSATDIRETSSTMGDKKYIVGRTDEKDKILASLSENMTKEFTVLPIYGIGGLGKTTLAKIVFSDSQFRDYSHVWIYVSRTFDLNKIGSSVISQLSNQKSQYTEKQMIHNSLRELLANKKILIVLDDLWEDNNSHLEELLGMLKVGESGKVIVIVTTRYEGIANIISTVQPHKLARLTSELCWTIIMQKSGFESRDDQEELQHIGKDIASKCGGVALAAQSLGHMLHSLTSDEWELVRNSDFWNLSDPEDTNLTNALASLKLSYSVMPAYLKICFAYCAIFPKGYKIVKYDLIHQWISLGFIKATNNLSTWQLGEKFIRQLLGLSFLEHSNSAMTTGVNFENDTLFTMHDLVHDLARFVMVDEILVTSKQGISGGNCYHFALLNDCRKPLKSSKIRALRFMDCVEIEFHGAAFSFAKSMHVLDLSECSIHKLPDSIGKLKQLRYLKAPRVQDERIPNSITKLSKLIYLNLHGSPKISALPKSIGRIEGLLYLNLSGCSRITKMPESFERLKELVHLDLSNCHIQKLPEALGTFIQLKYLNLSGCRHMTELPRSFGCLKNLARLDLSHCLMICRHEALVTLTKLQYLNLKNTNMNSLQDGLRYLNLSRRNTCEDTFDNLINHIGSNLTNLEHLDLSDNAGIRSIPDSLCSLRKLHTLNLSGCILLTKIPETMHTIGSLKFLYLDNCHLLKVPQLGSSAISLPHFQVHAAADESSSNLVRLQATNPVTLQISKLENVKSTEEAHCIKLMEKQSLLYLGLEWTHGVERFVDDKMLLEKLVPPRTLKTLDICGYNGVSFPGWLVGQLPNLESLVLRDMAKLEEWDMSSSYSEKYMFHSVQIHDCPMLRMKQPLPQAKFWVISYSDNVLSSWDEWTVSHTIASSSSSPVTIGLSILCHEVPLHQWRLLQHFPGISSLSITNCGDLTMSSEITRHLSALETLCLIGNHMEDLPKWLGELTSLQNLEISHFDSVKELNKNMRQLTRLQSLSLKSSHNIELPYWLGELTTLKKLVVTYNGVLRSLPGSIQQLTSLQKIEIINCPALEHVVVESEEGKVKLTHNLERVCVLPTSLKLLTISTCHGIKSLPEGTEQLTNLQELDIYNCPGLKHWCELEENKTKLAHIQYKVIRSQVNNARSSSDEGGEILC